MNKPRFTRKTLIDSACAHYGLENPVTIAMCEINEAHPNDDRYTFIYMALLAWVKDMGKTTHFPSLMQMTLMMMTTRNFGILK